MSPAAAQAPVLVTGGAGYLGSHLVTALLRDGREVRVSTRSTAREAALREAVRRGGADDAGLTLVTADLRSDDGWTAALDGVEEVYHAATPFPVEQPADPDELIVPARDGTVRVLRASLAAGARRVVLTSSFAAIGYTPKPGAEFTEDDWTDPDTPGLAPYPRSKTIAERAAWDLAGAAGGGTELVVVNPTFILGPTLSADLGSSLLLVKMLLEGAIPVLPRQRFGIVDVRDVADLHLRAMRTPGAAGRRYLGVGDGPSTSYLGLADILRARLGERASRVPAREAPGEDPPRPVIHNDRARTELGWRPRATETTVVESAESLFALGLVG